MKNRFDWDAKTMKGILRVIHAIMDTRQIESVGNVLKDTGFTMDEYHTICKIGMPAVQNSNLYKRTLFKYICYRKDVRGVVNLAREAMACGGDAELVLSGTLDQLEALYESYNHGQLGMTDEEAGVIKDD